jgi:glutamine cyclotransferase
MKTIFILIFLLITIKSQKTYINDPYINITIPEKSNDFILLKIIPKLNDSSTYTEGLFIDEEYDESSKSNITYLYETGGLFNSTLQKFKYPSMELVKYLNLSVENGYHFQIKWKEYGTGEIWATGIAKCNNVLFLTTRHEFYVYQYDIKTLEKKVTHFRNYGGYRNNYHLYSWGLTESNETNVLFGSDGTQKIYRLNCTNNLATINYQEVKFEGKIVPGIGDMVFVNGFIYANIYYGSKIAKIDIKDFTIVKYFDLSDLVDFELKKGFFTKYEFDRGKILNGIAYDKLKQNFLVTGKQWGNFYIIKFNE